jgi:ubiquinone/menaquinone biosynthesis C-methylase UbiE
LKEPFEGAEMPTAGALWPDPVGVLVEVGMKVDMGVIDLRSGDGWFTPQIVKPARHVVALDTDPALLVVARHRLVESDARNRDFVGDACNIL